MPILTPRPAEEVTVETLYFDDDGTVPNHPALPVVVMRGVLGPDVSARGAQDLARANGWGGTWQYVVFPFHHYHPNAHEMLAVVAGSAALTLGGPSGETVRVAAGDVLILPAGTGHRQVEASGDFSVCGAYPPGQEDYETLRADDPRPAGVAERIARVAPPRTDPVYGDAGPLLTAWSIA